MARLIVTTREGETREVTATPGLSVMTILRDAGIDELLSLCYGCLACATCHVIVDPADSDRIAPMESDERYLLDNADHREATSRLACQIVFDDALDGLHVTIAPTG